MTSKETKPLSGASRAEVPKQTIHRQFSARSPNSEAQRQRILAALRRRPQTTEDLRKIGIFQAATRVKELRDRFGYLIDTTLVTVIDREGFPHPRAALYSLRGEPEGAVR